MSHIEDLTPQQRFDALYITSNEVARRVGVTRAGLLQARRSGQLPGFVLVNGNDIVIWERAAIEPYLKAWELQRAARAARAELTHGSTNA